MANGFKHATQGSVLTQTEYEAEDTHVLDSQATGDIIYASSSSVLRRLAVGAENTTLQVSSGNIPEWVAAPTLGSGTTVGNITLANGSITDSSGAISFGDENLSTTGALSIASMGGNWTNASRTVADMGIVTTIDINGGTIDNAAIGGTTPAAIAGTTGTFSGLITANGGITFAAGDDIAFTGSTGTNDIVLTNGLADALSITDGSADVIAISTAGATNTVAITGNLTVSGTIDADTAAVATTVTITDNDATNEANAITFTAGGDVDGGNIGLESDSDLTYNPSTGKITAEGFIGALTGNADTVTTNANLTGDVTSSGNATSIASNVIVNADVNSSAAIAYSKLAALSDGNILVGNGSNVATSVNPSGDVDVSNAGVFSIASGVIVDADVNASAAIAVSKTALVPGTNISLSTNTLNVDDAFLINSGDDTTLGTISAAGFTVSDDSDIKLGEAGKVNFVDVAPDDGEATGVVLSFIADVTLAVGDLVYIVADGSDGKVGKADANQVTTMPAIGVAVTGVSADAPVEVLVQGLLRRNSAYGFTIGQDLFVSAAAVGGVTATAPSGSGDTVQKVGVALHADIAYYNFNTTEVLLA